MTPPIAQLGNGWSVSIDLQFHRFEPKQRLHLISSLTRLARKFSYERIFGDILAYTAAGQQYAQPYAVSQSAASLGIGAGDSFSVGVEYTDSPDFKTSARFEHHNSDLGDNPIWSIAAAGKVSPALTALLRFQHAHATNQHSSLFGG